MNTTATNNDRARAVPSRRGASAGILKCLVPMAVWWLRKGRRKRDNALLDGPPSAFLCCPRRRGRLPRPGHEGHRRKRAVAGERPPQGGGIPSRGAFNQRAGRYAGLPI